MKFSIGIIVFLFATLAVVEITSLGFLPKTPLSKPLSSAKNKTANAAGAVTGAVKNVLPPALSENNIAAAWLDYKNVFNRSYGTVEEIARRALFVKSFTDIILHNVNNFEKGLSTFKLGVNALADATVEELKKLSALRVSRDVINSKQNPEAFNADLSNAAHGSNETTPASPEETTSTTTVSSESSTDDTPKFKVQSKRVPPPPESVDWREKKIVAPVRNQGFCGSCYAFSAVSAIESQYAKKKNKLIELSEQQLVDCSESFGNDGCDGGLQEYAFKYVKDNGIVSSSKYKYTSNVTECKLEANDVVTKLSGHVRVPKSEEDLKKAVAFIGPVSIALDISAKEFQLYSDGIFEVKNCSTTDLNHGMVVVGYGTDNGKDFWWIRNSWGDSWGLKGYMKLARNKENMCGIATYAVYPKLK